MRSYTPVKCRNGCPHLRSEEMSPRKIDWLLVPQLACGRDEARTGAFRLSRRPPISLSLIHHSFIHSTIRCWDPWESFSSVQTPPKGPAPSRWRRGRGVGRGRAAGQGVPTVQLFVDENIQLYYWTTGLFLPSPLPSSILTEPFSGKVLKVRKSFTQIKQGLSTKGYM